MESRILLRNDCLVAIPDAILITDPGLLVPASLCIQPVAIRVLCALQEGYLAGLAGYG